MFPWMMTVMLVLAAFPLGAQGQVRKIRCSFDDSNFTLSYNTASRVLIAYRSLDRYGNVIESVEGNTEMRNAGFSLLAGDFSGYTTIIKRQTNSGITMYNFTAGGSGDLEIMLFQTGQDLRYPLQWTILE